MIIAYITALASVGFFVILAEAISRYRPNMKRELTRKIAHIGSAVAISIWPFYLDWETIRVLGVILTLGVMIAIHFKLTNSIHKVARRNYGELLFGLAIVTAAYTATTPAIFCVAILFMGLADGLAAVTGTLWGKRNEYHILGAKKSWVGSLTFFVVALIITALYGLMSGHALPLVIYAVLPLTATLLESVSRWGLDNILVPLVAIIMLNLA